MAMAHCFPFWCLVLPLRERNHFMIKLQDFSAQKIIFFSALGLFFFFFFLFFFYYFAHTNNYNTLHLQFITGNCYRLQKRKKKTKKDKVDKNTIVYILTIKRRLPALWSSITHLPVCHLHFGALFESSPFLP